MTGLKTAGALLPAMGMAILMRYLPIKKYWYYFVIGFVLIAYGGGNYTVMAAALAGIAFAGMHLARTNNKTVAVTGQAVIEDDEEVEIDG